MSDLYCFDIHPEDFSIAPPPSCTREIKSATMNAKSQIELTEEPVTLQQIMDNMNNLFAVTNRKIDEFQEEMKRRIEAVEEEQKAICERVNNIEKTIATTSQLRKELDVCTNQWKEEIDKLRGSTNLILFGCPYCAKKFLTNDYLFAHIQRRHQGLPINPLYPNLYPPGAVVQDELKSLILRFESQGQFWQEKLVSVQQNHEKQIQQVREELLQNTKNDNQTSEQVPHANADPIVVDKSQLKYEDEDNDTENALPSDGIIVVGPKPNHNQTIPYHQQQLSNPNTSPSCGAPRDTSPSNDAPLPVPKPRKSKVAADVILSSEMEDIASASVTHSRIITNNMKSPHQQHDESGVTAVQRESLSQSDPQSLNLVVLSPTIRTEEKPLHQQHNVPGGTTVVQLESLSESQSQAEYLPIVHPEEFHEPDDSSIVNTVESLRKNKKDQSSCLASLNSDFKRMNKSGSIDGEWKSDEVSDYTLSDSVDEGVDEQNISRNRNDRELHLGNTQFIDNSRGKSMVRQASVKKKYIFDDHTRKIVEVSPDKGEADSGDEFFDNNGDMNNADDDNAANERKNGRKSQLDLVRAKTEMEMEQQMTDIGLNPESTAIGLEEMGRALKHLKLQRRTTGDQIHNYEKFEEERNSVKTLAKFAATKSSIDGQLDAISTLSTKNKPPQSSLGKIFSAVKTSGKNFRKRVASAVKKKPKPDDETDDKRQTRKKKPSSAPPLKRTFFSKSRWARKKNSDDPSPSRLTGKKTAENSDDDESTGESSEEIELPFMTHSKPISPKTSMQSRGTTEHYSTSRSRSRSHSRPRSGKPLKRLNSSSGNNILHPPSSPVAVTVRSRSAADEQTLNNNDDEKRENDNRQARAYPSPNSSESPPFTDIDDDDEVMYDSNEDSEDVNTEQADSSGVKHKVNKENGRQDFRRINDKSKSDPTRAHSPRSEKLLPTSGNRNDAPANELVSDDDDDDDDDDWDDDEPLVNTARKMHDLHQKSKDPIGRTHSPRADTYTDNDVSDFESNVGGTSTPMRHSYKTDIDEPLSEDRLKQIKRIIQKNKKDLKRDETSSSAEEFDIAETGTRGINRNVGKLSTDRENRSAESIMTTISKAKENTIRFPVKFGEQNQRWNERQAASGLYTHGQQPEADHLASSRFLSSQARFMEIIPKTISLNDTATHIKQSENNDITHKPEGHIGRNTISGGTSLGLGHSENPKRILNSSEEIENDVRDLLNTTISDDENGFETHKAPHSFSTSFMKQDSQRTKYNNTKEAKGMGAGSQNGLRRSGSNNSWDSQK